MIQNPIEKMLELQVNLYNYIKTFLSEKFIIDIPYEKSERIRLKIN